MQIQKRCCTFLNNQAGFTLLELVVATGLFVLLALFILDATWRAFDVEKRARAGFNETSELRAAVMWVTRDLRCAEGVDEAAPGRLELVVGGNTVTYTLRDGNLVREEGGTRRTVARDLTAASFVADDRDGGVLVTAEFAGAKDRVRTAVWVSSA